MTCTSLSHLVASQFCCLATTNIVSIEFFAGGGGGGGGGKFANLDTVTMWAKHRECGSMQLSPLKWDC